MKVALVTCRLLPEPDADQELLLYACRARGLDAELAAWDDPSVAWERFELAVLRSTWNYHLAPDRFASWLGRAATATRILNPPDVVRGNLHKRYLVELAMAGLPVVPTALLTRGSGRRLADVLDTHGWGDVVIKPAISAASRDTVRVGAGAHHVGEAHLAGLVEREDTLVQAYQPAVEEHGERALVWIDGAFTHAVRKSPRFSADAESVSEALPISPAELALGRRALASYTDELLYARVDVVPAADGSPRIMELELIEPSLFLRQAPAALERLVRAIARSARRGR